MSDEKEDFFKNLAEDSEIDKKKKELEANRVNNQYERLKENQQKDLIMREADFGPLTVERISTLAKESTDYIDSARHNSMTFIDAEVFENAIPFFPKNLILIGAKTGEGKSTCVANIVRSVLGQTNKATGRARRCLVITNEESEVDFYNRVTCLIKGWHYVNHDKFTDEQQKTFEQYIKILSSNGRLRVISDSEVLPNGKVTMGTTTTVEGIDRIFQNLMENAEFYDVVLIDYYQNVTESTKDPTLNEFEVQSRLTHVLEKWRKVYPAPIVLMAQVNPPEKESPSPFQVRLQGRKIITTKATVIVEMIADKENLKTEWFFWKGRFSESTGTSVCTGYKKGLFVPYTNDFAKSVQKMKEEKAAREQDKAMGIKLKEEPENEKRSSN